EPILITDTEDSLEAEADFEEIASDYGSIKENQDKLSDNACQENTVPVEFSRSSPSVERECSPLNEPMDESLSSKESSSSTHPADAHVHHYLTRSKGPAPYHPWVLPKHI